MKFCFGFLVLILAGVPARADDSFAGVSEKVNPKVVKLFGSGGFTGLVSYGTGVLVSPDGYILTVAGHMLDTQDLRVHLSDGRRFVIESSSNLRSCHCAEQTTIIADPGLYDFHAGWMNRALGGDPPGGGHG